MHPARRRSFRCRPSSALVPVLLAASCRLAPDHVPAAPVPDFDSLTTARAVVVLSGHAEPGSRLVVARDPVMDWDAVAPTRADAGGGRWSVTVPLEPPTGSEPRRNTFSIVAKGLDGHDSPPARVVVQRVLPAAVGIVLDLEETVVAPDRTGHASLLARARVALNDPTLPADGRAVTFHVDGYVRAIPDASSATGTDGLAVARVEGLGGAGKARLVARVEGTEIVSEAVAFEVLPGRPAAATLALQAAAGTTENGVLVVPAGTEVTASLAATDAAGGAVDAAWTLETDAPGAFVAGTRVRFLRAGSSPSVVWNVLARVRDGTGRTLDPAPSAKVSVRAGTGSGSSPVLVPSVPAESVAGVPFNIDAVLLDGWGNVLPAGTVTATTTDAAGTVSGRSVTLRTAGFAAVTVKADRGGGQVVSAPPVTVRTSPAAPASLALLLAGQSAPPDHPYAAVAGRQIAVSAAVRDAFSNAIPRAPVTLSASRPLEPFGLFVTAPSAPGLYAVNGIVDGTSIGATAVLQVSPGAPASVTLICPAQATAGIPVACDASVLDANRNPLPVAASLSVDASSAGATVSGRYVTLIQAGSATVSATAGALRAVRTVAVSPAAAASLRLTVNPAAVLAGGTTNASVSIVDAFLNPVSLPVELRTDIPGATVTGSTIDNIGVVGTFHVFASASPAAGRPGLADTATLSVAPADAAPAHVVLSVPGRTVAGVPVRATTTVTDARGNPLSSPVSIAVDGSTPDRVAAVWDPPMLTLRTPGAHRVAAVADGVTDERIVDAVAEADLTPPSVSVSVAPSGTGPRGFFKPGAVLDVRVEARDDRGLAGVRLYAYSSDLGLDRSLAQAFALPTVEADVRFRVELPSDRVGRLFLTAAASDTGGNGTGTPAPVVVSDFHFDRIAFPATPGATARSASVSAALGTPGAVAVAPDGGVYVASPGPGSPPTRALLQLLGDGGVPGPGWTTADDAGTGAFAVLPGASPGGWFLFAGMTRTLQDDQVVVRFGPGIPAPETCTTPPLGKTQGAVFSGASVHAATKTLYLGQSGASAGMSGRGRLWSMPARDGTSGFTVDVGRTSASQEVFVRDLPEHDVRGVCANDGATTDLLYFTAIRTPTGGGARKAGVYSMALESDGRLRTGAAPATVDEEDASVGTAERVCGPCIRVTGPSGASSLLFTRWEEGPGGPTGGSVVSLPAVGGARSIVATGAAGTPLGRLPGLARSGGRLWVTEADGRVVRLDGLY